MSGTLPRLVAALLLAVVASACLDPLEDDSDEGSAPEAPLGSETPDPAGEVLAQEVERIVELLDQARDLLLEAAEAEDLSTAKSAAARVEQVLIGDPGQGDVLFPVETLDRGGLSGRDDLMTRTLTAARDRGGEDGRIATETLRDLVAGDLGGWQRDAEGMVAWVDDVAVERSSLEETEQAVRELPGGGTQALAYALLIERTSSLERARDYGERGAAHLEVARSLLADLELGDDEPDGEAAADDRAVSTHPEAMRP